VQHDIAIFFAPNALLYLFIFGRDNLTERPLCRGLSCFLAGVAVATKNAERILTLLFGFHQASIKMGSFSELNRLMTKRYNRE